MITINPLASTAEVGDVVVAVTINEGGFGTLVTTWLTSDEARALGERFGQAADEADRFFLDKEEADQAALDAADPTDAEAELS